LAYLSLGNFYLTLGIKYPTDAVCIPSFSFNFPALYFPYDYFCYDYKEERHRCDAENYHDDEEDV
jgi:hypothetical protein